VKVLFHWDRKGKKDENSSCWIRVSHPWAGKGWGSVATPRIGQEVIVDFLEGDPDQPIITGRVYNAEQVPPYALPAHKTQSGVKSRSSLGGSPDHFNEIRFEDEKGQEQLFIHAERNQDIEVEANETHSVGGDRTKTVGSNETVKIGVNRTEEVGGNESILIGGNRTESVTGNEMVYVWGQQNLDIDGSQSTRIISHRELYVHGHESVTVGGDRRATVAGDETLSVYGDQNIQIGSNQAKFVKGDVSEYIRAHLRQLVAGDTLIKTSYLFVDAQRGVTFNTPILVVKGATSLFT
jgi:type VI secretion system secreted protein VgrG